MLPKLHRRTPPSAHTYRLLIFKELQNSLAFALLSIVCKSLCLRQQRSGIMICFAISVKPFSLAILALSCCRIALFTVSKEARLCAASRFSSSAALTATASHPADEALCPSTEEPAIMRCFRLLVKHLSQNNSTTFAEHAGRLSAIDAPRASDSFLRMFSAEGGRHQTSRKLGDRFSINAFMPSF